jgi:branched-chain amino acid transport system substrate-binding protein
MLTCLNRFFTVLVLAAGIIPSASAQIVIGHTSGFTGPVSGVVKELAGGANLYFDHINAQGGINGQKIQLVTLDDAFDPKKSAANAKILVEEKGAIALFLTRGTPHTQAMLEVAKASGTPIVAPSTGAAVFHEPVNPLIFNVRAKYQTEAAKAIEQLQSVGINKIAVVHVNDSFGKDALAGFDAGFKTAKIQPVVTVTYEREKPDMRAVFDKVAATNPQAVVMSAAAAQSVELVRIARAAKATMQFVMLSNVSSQSFITDLGELGRGVQVMQVFPNPNLATYPLSLEMQRIAAAKPGFVISHAAMEGFASAKVLVAGLRKAGKNITRASLVDGLNSLGTYDLGGLKLNFSPTDHSGIEFAEPSMIDKRGRFLQL